MGDKKTFDPNKELCDLKKEVKYNVEEYLKLVADPRFLCTKCGRVAKFQKNLCKTVPLKK